MFAFSKDEMIDVCANIKIVFPNAASEFTKPKSFKNFLDYKLISVE